LQWNILASVGSRKARRGAWENNNLLMGSFPQLSLNRDRSERAYPKLIHFNKLDKGGHFAAFEQPQLLSEEVRAGFRSLRRELAKAA
jgi:hypothetical protein